MLDLSAPELPVMVEQVSDPRRSPSQIPGTMPEAQVIPAPANTMDDDGDANLASVADVLHEKTVPANSGEQTQRTG